MKKIIIAVMCLLFPSLAFGASSVVADSASNYYASNRYSVKHWNVTSHTDGVVSPSQLGVINSEIVRVEFQIDETDTPTEAFDCYLYTDNTTVKLDLLGGEGTNRPVASDSAIIPLVGNAYSSVIYNGNPYLSCANMGASKKFILKILTYRY